MRTTRGLTVVVLTCLVWVTALPALGTSSLDDHGWWWRVAGLSGLPSPPWVPEGGLAVSRDIQGPSAIAAVRYEVGDDVSTATLTLEVASEQGGETAAIRACPARARWRGADPGDWEHRPGADCDAGEARGERDEEGETWTFDVSLLIDEGTLNVILLPASDDEVPDAEAPASGASAADEDAAGPPFQVAFEPPTDDSLEASEGFGFGDADEDEFDQGGFETGDTSTDQSGQDEPQEATGPDFATDSGASMAPDTGGQQQGSSAPMDAAAPQVADADDPDDAEDEDIEMMPPETAEEQPQAQEQETAMGPVAFGQDRARQLAAAIALMTLVATVGLWLTPRGVARLHGLRPSLIVRPEVASALGAAGGGHGDGGRGLGRFIKSREGAPPPL